jgi:hypothetical protein
VDLKSRGVNLEDTVTVSENVVFREVDGETVLLDLGSGVYFGLNATGTRIWQLLKQGSLRTILDLLKQEYDMPSEALKGDVLQLVQRLYEKNLVSIIQTEG